MHKFTKKRIAIGALGLLVVVGAAVAYFTTTGSGTGEAKVGTSTGLTINAEIEPETLYPGGEPSEVTFKVVNPSKASQRVTDVELTGVNAFTTAGHETAKSGCESGWFAMTDVPEDETVPGEETAFELPSTGDLEFVDNGANQDACKGAFLVAHFSITSE